MLRLRIMPFKSGKNAKYQGMRGGRVGGKAKAAKMTPEERSAMAKELAKKRWANRKKS
jgi:hypothetical protein